MQEPNVDATNGRALRHVFGINRRSPQIDNLAKHHYAEAFQPLPPATGSYPFRLDLEDVLGADGVAHIQQQGRLVFHTVGDTGNASHGADAQEAVAFHMEQQVQAAQASHRPAFFYHLGDVVYFNGERKRYEAQFYDPYLNYPPPIFSIAGNHDGSTFPGGESSLRGFIENFCSAQPLHTWMAGHSNRTTMIQPNVYWTLRSPLVTIIGLYSNVPGQLDKTTPQQEKWLASELKQAPHDRFVIVAVHHPPYSLDEIHGGHLAIRESLDRAMQKAGRIPDMVLTGHVHNYQRFEVKISGRLVPYVVAGAGGFAGYSTLHQLKAGVQPPPGVRLVAHDTKLPGFLRLTVTADRIEGEYFAVPPPPGHLSGTAQSVDQFSIVRGG